MSSSENEEFTLGRNVTGQAKSNSRGGTAVVAVRLSLEEISQIESISRDTGKTISHIVRDAVRNWLRFEVSGQPTITLTWEGGGTATMRAGGAQGCAEVVEGHEVWRTVKIA